MCSRCRRRSLLLRSMTIGLILGKSGALFFSEPMYNRDRLTFVGRTGMAILLSNVRKYDHYRQLPRLPSDRNRIASPSAVTAVR